MLATFIRSLRNGVWDHEGYKSLVRCTAVRASSSIGRRESGGDAVAAARAPSPPPHALHQQQVCSPTSSSTSSSNDSVQQQQSCSTSASVVVAGGGTVRRWMATFRSGSVGGSTDGACYHQSYRIALWPSLFPAAAAAATAAASAAFSSASAAGGRPGPWRGGAGNSSGGGGPRAPPAGGARSPQRQQQQQQPRRPRVNAQITAPEVRAVLPEGAGSRVMPTHEALALARAAGLDLIEVPGTGGGGGPPVARIASWEAAQAAARKAEEEAARRERLRAKLATPKEMQFTARIGDHDLEIKLRKVEAFLDDGLRVALLVKHRRNEGPEASGAALDYILERLRAARSGLEESKRTTGARNVGVTVWWPEAVAARTSAAAEAAAAAGA